MVQLDHIRKETQTHSYSLSFALSSIIPNTFANSQNVHKAISKPGRVVWQHLYLRLSASKTGRKKFLLFKPFNYTFVATQANYFGLEDLGLL